MQKFARRLVIGLSLALVAGVVVLFVVFDRLGDRVDRCDDIAAVPGNAAEQAPACG